MDFGIDSHSAIHLAAALKERPRDERLGRALDSARKLYAVVAAGEMTNMVKAEEVIAEFLLARDEDVRRSVKREAMLDAQAAVRGAVGAAERALREALSKASTLADRWVE